MAFKCTTCGGEFAHETAPGVAYYHACPPVLALRVRNLDGSTSIVAPGAEAGRPVVAEVVRDRPQNRDENVVQLDPTRPGTPKAVGRGTTVVPD